MGQTKLRIVGDDETGPGLGGVIGSLSKKMEIRAALKSEVQAVRDSHQAAFAKVTASGQDTEQERSLFDWWARAFSSVEAEAAQAVNHWRAALAELADARHQAGQFGAQISAIDNRLKAARNDVAVAEQKVQAAADEITRYERAVIEARAGLAYCEARGKALDTSPVESQLQGARAERAAPEVIATIEHELKMRREQAAAIGQESLQHHNNLKGANRNIVLLKTQLDPNASPEKTNLINLAAGLEKAKAAVESLNAQREAAVEQQAIWAARVVELAGE